MVFETLARKNALDQIEAWFSTMPASETTGVAKNIKILYFTTSHEIHASWSKTKHKPPENTGGFKRYLAEKRIVPKSVVEHNASVKND